MAKIGKEVEGRKNYGDLTLFVSADEFTKHYDRIVQFTPRDFKQIYISDHYGDLTFTEKKDPRLAHWNITVETKCISPKRPYPEWVGIMFNISDGVSVEQLNCLSYNDEIKISSGLDVWSWSKRDAVRTYPADFEGDIEVTL